MEISFSSDGLDVEIVPLFDIDAFMESWKDVEKGAEASFFVSSRWVESWLRSLPADRLPYQCRIHSDTRTVGIALIGAGRALRRAMIRSRTLSLHETGDRTLDVLTVEHNRLLAERGFEELCWNALLGALASGVRHWDELFVSGVTAAERERIEDAARCARLLPKVLATKPYYFVDMRRLRDDRQEYLAALSKNTRHQVRRTAKLLAAEHGEVAIRFAESADDALACFAALCELHEAYWHDRGSSGAFSSELSRRFHRRLVADGSADGSVQLAHVTAGDHTVGYLYNFVYDGVVSSYQSGFSYSQDNRIKPGLLSHWLAVEENMGAGNHVYDFLMGRSQYKGSLSTHSADMHWMALQRPRLLLRLETLAQSLKHRLEQRRAAG